MLLLSIQIERGSKLKTISIHNYPIGQQEFITVDDSIVADCDILEDYLIKRYNKLSNIEYMVIADWYKIKLGRIFIPLFTPTQLTPKKYLK